MASAFSVWHTRAHTCLSHAASSAESDINGCGAGEEEAE